MKRNNPPLPSPRRPVLRHLIGSGMVQKLMVTGLGAEIARDPNAMEWLHCLRAEMLLEERCGPRGSKRT